MASTGNATDFGDLTVARQELCGTGTSTRGISAGGVTSSPTRTTTIDYVTIATLGDAADYGDLTIAVSGFDGNSTDHGGLQ